MKVTGIAAEYNPFHEGHRYHIEAARRLTGADYIIAAMSGDFVQRGEPAVFDKYARTETALRGGADLVLELPALFATGSAEDFAAGAVSLFEHTGCVDSICFGSECGDIAALEQAAAILAEEPQEYRQYLQAFLQNGDSFPKAREQALERYSSNLSLFPALLAKPNNILGIEYMKALLRRNSAIAPFTIRRAGQDYHDDTPAAQDVYPSASSLRRLLREQETDRNIPENSTGAPAVFPDDLSLLLNHELLRLSACGTDLTRFADFSESLSDRISGKILDFTSFTGRIAQLKTRQYTYTRISRALLHLLLGFTADDAAQARALDYTPYLRILGFRRSAAPLLTALKANASVPIISKTADAQKILPADACEVFRKDVYASHLYQTVQAQKKGMCMPNEYTHSPVMIE